MFDHDFNFISFWRPSFYECSLSTKVVDKRIWVYYSFLLACALTDLEKNAAPSWFLGLSVAKIFIQITRLMSSPALVLLSPNSSLNPMKIRIQTCVRIYIERERERERERDNILLHYNHCSPFFLSIVR